MTMSLKIVIILYVLCHPAFCSIRQPFGMKNPAVLEKYTDPRTIISRIQNDTKDCLIVDPKYFELCDRPEHTLINNKAYLDFDMILCMNSYDAALRICEKHNTDVLKNLQKAMEQEKEETGSVFCNRMKSVLVESSFPQTKEWVSLLIKQFSNGDDNCKRECVQPNSINPLCKFVLFANSLSLQFEKNKSSSPAITTDKTVSTNQEILPNLIPNAVSAKSHRTKFDNVKKADHVSPVNNTHAQVAALRSSQKTETNTSDVDTIVKNKNSATQSSELTDKKINQKNVEQDQSLINKTIVPVEESKVIPTIKSVLMGEVNENKGSQSENEATKETSSSNSIMQQTSSNNKKQEPVPQNNNRSQNSTTQDITTVPSQLSDTDKSKLESVIPSTSSTELPKPEKGEDVQTKSKPVDVDMSKTQGTDGEDGTLLYDPSQDAGVESSIAESPTESSEMQDTDVGIGLDDEDQDITQHDAETTDAELGKDKGPIGGSDNVFGDQFVNAEDSHFFAYFMTMVVLCIIGYLVFHNKQKILALALEGRARRGTRRRPNTSGYRKLDSNLEEAVTSACSTSVTHVIY